MREVKITDDLPTFQANVSPDSQEIYLADTDKNHAINVLRLKPDSFCFATDGRGGFWKARIINFEGQLTIVESLSGFGESLFRPRLVVGVLKHPQHWEWLLEKTTELGAIEITPLYCERTDKHARINRERCQKILWAAVKQCRRSFLPMLQESVTFSEWFNALQNPERCWLANQNGSDFPVTTAHHSLDTCLIGPEGDFSQNELKKLAAIGIPAFNIGKNRLRAETAAIVALAYMNAGFSNR